MTWIFGHLESSCYRGESKNFIFNMLSIQKFKLWENTLFSTQLCFNKTKLGKNYWRKKPSAIYRVNNRHCLNDLYIHLYISNNWFFIDTSIKKLHILHLFNIMSKHYFHIQIGENALDLWRLLCSICLAVIKNEMAINHCLWARTWWGKWQYWSACCRGNLIHWENLSSSAPQELILLHSFLPHCIQFCL